MRCEIDAAPVHSNIGGGQIAGHFKKRELQDIQQIEASRGGNARDQSAVMSHTGEHEAHREHPPGHHADSADDEVLEVYPPY